MSGDWNQWPLAHVLQEHPDLFEVDHGPTRNDRKIDRTLVNFPRSVTESDTLPPLDDGQGWVSDHLVSYFKAAIKKSRQPLVRYKYRHYTDEGAAKFQAWISSKDFSSVLEKQDPNEQLSDFLGSLEGAMNVCFPYKTTVRRERDPPWINRYVLAIIRKRRKVYHREGRSTKWKELMKPVRRLVRKRARKYWDHQKRTLLKPDAMRAFFKNAKAYSSREKPSGFNVTSLFDNSVSEAQVAERLADHFNGISSEFQGLDLRMFLPPTAAPFPLFFQTN